MIDSSGFGAALFPSPISFSPDDRSVMKHWMAFSDPFYGRDNELEMVYRND